ncbi:MAG: type II toxin-antitoxin system RelE/ParE family toxin [Actinomycetota bacterium]|nr:type II toxin-antitoxin system RelE/ParE family toxin [Actinomycetota bacterium]MDZ4180039.1 type II toxin-antitoxin system RelE/ParE family toxin [Coriobacteriia bacterium]
MRVRFTPSADRQYLSALRYLVERSPAGAAVVQQRVEDVVDQLGRFPDSGHVIPEFPQLPHRELPAVPYRVFHRVAGDTVWIVNVWHSSQVPEPPDDLVRG